MAKLPPIKIRVGKFSKGDHPPGNSRTDGKISAETLQKAPPKPYSERQRHSSTVAAMNVEEVLASNAPAALEDISDIQQRLDTPIIMTKHLSATDSTSNRSLRRSKHNKIQHHESLIRIAGSLNEANKLVAESERINGRALEIAQSKAVAEGIKSVDRADSTEFQATRLIVPIEPNDSTLMALVKELLIRTEVFVDDIYALIKDPDFHWLNSDTQVYNYIYGLRSRNTMTFETAERWMAMIGCRFTLSVEKLSFNELKKDTIYTRMQNVTNVLEATPETASEFLTPEDIDRYVYNRTCYDVSSVGEPTPGYEGNLRSRPEEIKK